MVKKLLFLFISTVFTVCVYAQEVDYEDYFKDFEKHSELNLTADQVAKIKKLNREIGPQFRQIGQNSSLSGYEKGQRKRALALRHKNEILKILNKNQLDSWEKRYGQMEEGLGIKDSMTDNYDRKLEALEERYDREKHAIENNSSLSKDERKRRKKALKDNYKIEKDRLKDEKNNVKGTTLLR